jgi:hypothetical protein
MQLKSNETGFRYLHLLGAHHLSRQPLKHSISRFPGFSVFRRLILLYRERVADDFSGFGDVADRAGGHGLHHHVADGGGFDRAGDDAAVAGVGGELAELPVEGAAADDVDRANLGVGEFFQVAEHLPVAEREAFQGAAHHRPFIGRLRLAGATAVVAHRLRHIGRGEERGVVGVHHGDERLRLVAQAQQRFPGEFATLLRPDAAAFLDEPEPADVFQQANRAADASFVREVELQATIVDHWAR